DADDCADQDEITSGSICIYGDPHEPYRPLLEGDIIGLRGSASVLDGSHRATRGPRSQRFNPVIRPPRLSTFRPSNFVENKAGAEKKSLSAVPVPPAVRSCVSARPRTDACSRSRSQPGPRKSAII